MVRPADDSSGFGLPEVLAALRRDLDAASAVFAAGDREPLLFVQGAEVELTVAVERASTGKGELSFRVFGIGVGGGGERSKSQANTHTIKLILQPGGENTIPALGDEVEPVGR
jgi:hypothetical protein